VRGIPPERGPLRGLIAWAAVACVLVAAAALLAAAVWYRLASEALADYKVPKRVFCVASIGRSPAGKMDYKAITETAKRLAERGQRTFESVNVQARAT
jgi:non-ribosomal peptide synthetase component E (peptide arylation enzyme)